MMLGLVLAANLYMMGMNMRTPKDGAIEYFGLSDTHLCRYRVPIVCQRARCGSSDHRDRFCRLVDFNDG